ncbi:MAG: hypothetical protein RLZZ337_1739 [Bacteroidota bacterium]
MKKTLTYLSFILMVLAAAQVQAQTNLKLKINPKLGELPFALDEEATNDYGNIFKVLRLEYYISGISVTHDGGKVTEFPTIYVLQQGTDLNPINLGTIDATTIESISFCVGVDQGQNHKDPSRWPSSHALSPKSPSMHWGWESGYRFAVIEGSTGENFMQKFAIHALGNKNYFKLNIPVTTEMVDGAELITLNADYTKIISGINLNVGVFNHGEDGEAAEALRNFQTKVFTSTTGQGNTLSIDQIESSNLFELYPNPSSGTLYIKANQTLASKTTISITDLAGSTIYEGDYTNDPISLITKGLYFIHLSQNGITSTKKLIIQ